MKEPSAEATTTRSEPPPSSPASGRVESAAPAEASSDAEKAADESAKVDAEKAADEPVKAEETKAAEVSSDTKAAAPTAAVADEPSVQLRGDVQTDEKLSTEPSVQLRDDVQAEEKVESKRGADKAADSKREGKGAKKKRDSKAPEAIDTPMALEVTKPEEVDEFEEAFFSSLPPAHAGDFDDEPESAADLRLRRLHAPEVVERRTRMRRVVMGAVAGCAALLALGLVRASFDRNDTTNPTTPVAANEPVTPPAPSVAEPTPQPSTPTAAIEPSAAPVESATAPVESAALVESAAPVESTAAPVEFAAPVESAPPAASSAPVESAPPVASAAPSTDDAKALRSQARRLLESGKANAAIEPAQQSTALDPEHAEGWLLLGAAYQDRGRMAEARAAFQQCVSQAKRGPRGECAAMLR